MRSHLALAPFILASTSFAQTTWTVSETDPLADFADIQPAIAAAAAGDTLLVRAGDYTEFEIDGKAVNITGEAGARFTMTESSAFGPMVRIANIPAGSSVTIRGMEIDPNGLIFASSFVGIDLVGNAGEVWLEDIDVDYSFSIIANTLHAIRISNSASVTMIGCTAAAGPASEGLRISTSNVYVFDCSFLGGTGAAPTASNFLDGGDGVVLSSGELYASDSTFQGGVGLGTSVFVCNPTTDGGRGAVIDGGLFRDRSSTISGGAGGSGAICAVPDGAPGQGMVVSGGTHLPIIASPARVSSSSPVSEGATSTQVYSGDPGELVLATIGFTLDVGVFVPELAGPLLLGDPKFFRFCGLTNAAGTRTKSFTVLDFGLDSVTVYFHPSFFDPGALVWRTGTPTAVTYLDAGL